MGKIEDASYCSSVGHRVLNIICSSTASTLSRITVRSSHVRIMLSEHILAGSNKIRTCLALVHRVNLMPQCDLNSTMFNLREKGLRRSAFTTCRKSSIHHSIASICQSQSIVHVPVFPSHSVHFIACSHCDFDVAIMSHYTRHT